MPRPEYRYPGLCRRAGDDWLEAAENACSPTAITTRKKMSAIFMTRRILIFSSARTVRVVFPGRCACADDRRGIDPETGDQGKNLNSMPNKQTITAVIVEQGILPLYFNADETVSVDVLRAIYRAGIKAVEYTNRGEAALKNFRRLVAERNAGMPELMFGVGTIKKPGTGLRLCGSRRRFHGKPRLCSRSGRLCQQYRPVLRPWLYDPSEIIAAENNKIGFIKLFPETCWDRNF